MVKLYTIQDGKPVAIDFASVDGLEAYLTSIGHRVERRLGKRHEAAAFRYHPVFVGRDIDGPYSDGEAVCYSCWKAL